MMTLTDFLLERIAEDEAGAKVAVGEFPTWSGRMRAECDAKRKIIDHHGAYDPPMFNDCSSCGDVPSVRYPCATLRFLALPYADHPDYREEWKP